MDRPAGGERRHSRTILALAFGGVAFVLLQLIVGTQLGLFPIPSRDELIWDRVGDSLWTGIPIYFNAPELTDSFWYAPPLAVVFAALLVRTGWARAIAATIAVPAFYWGSLVVLIAPLAIFLRGRSPTTEQSVAVQPA